MSNRKKRVKIILYIPILLIALCSIFIFYNASSASEHQNTQAEQTIKAETKSVSWAKYLAASISVGLGCVAAGIAVAQVGSAAIGAISEKPELFGRALTFVGLSEGIAIWGLIIAILILYA